MINIEPKLNYFSIWAGAFRFMTRHFKRATLAMLLIAGPFFIINGLGYANYILTTGMAQMQGMMLSPEEWKKVWGIMVATDGLASITMLLAIFCAFKYVDEKSDEGFLSFAKDKILPMLGSLWFWLFLILEFVVMAMIDEPSDGRFKLSGMALFPIVALFFWASQDTNAPAAGKRFSQITWIGWISLALVVLTYPILYIAFNGFVDQILLHVVDFGGQQVQRYFDMSKPTLPTIIITVSKFLSQWFNLILLSLIMGTHLALRRLVTPRTEAAVPSMANN